jgi:hypothetical protein
MSEGDRPESPGGAAVRKIGRAQVPFAGGMRGRANPFLRRIFERLAQPMARRPSGDVEAHARSSPCAARYYQARRGSGTRPPRSTGIYQALELQAREKVFDTVDDPRSVS